LAISCISGIRPRLLKLQYDNERYRMLEILRRGPVAVFRVFDRDGKAIGEVVEPRSIPVVGVGASTVLLVRGEEPTAYLPPKTFC
jgi:hypothetical protein